VLSSMSLLNEVYGAVTQGKQMYVLVVGSLLADEAHSAYSCIAAHFWLLLWLWTNLKATGAQRARVDPRPERTRTSSESL
jgi:hypothetical protein